MSVSSPSRIRCAGWLSLSALSLALLACGGSDDTVTPPAATAPVAQDDALTLLPGRTASVLSNDTLDGVAATTGNVSYTTSGALPTGVSVTDGVISLANDIAAGSYSFSYQLCRPSTTTCDTATVALTVPPYGNIGGRALDANTGEALAGVSVSLGDAQATTDATGTYVLPGVALVERASVVFEGSGHIQTSRITRVIAGTNTLDVRMLPYAGEATLPIATGGVATLPGSVAQVTLPANGLVKRLDGSAATGNVRVRMTPIQPAIDSTQMPGDFQTVVNGVLTPLESWGAMNVRLYDDAGNELNLASGAQATIRIPLSTRSSSPPATVPLYHFDQPNGVWVEEGSAELGGTVGSRYYEGTVTHFTTWNADRVYDTIYVNGCLADANGARVSGAPISADGISYSGTSSGYTAADGSFRLPMMKSGLATLIGYANGLFSNTLSVGPSDAEITLESCLTLNAVGTGATIKLTWGERPWDLDSHLFAPDGSQVWYRDKGSLTQSPFANLDVDDTTSYGPEVVTLSRMMVGTYRYAVHNYSGQNNGMLSASGARVELNVFGQPLQLYVAGAGDDLSTQVWNVFEFDVDAQCGVTVRRVNAYATGYTPFTPVAATYCTAP